MSKRNDLPLIEPRYEEIRDIVTFIANLVNDISIIFKIDKKYIGKVDDNTFKDIERVIFEKFMDHYSPLIAVSNYEANNNW